MIAVEPGDLVALAAVLKERVGLHVRADGLQALRLALTARLEELAGAASTARGYLKVFETEAGDEELRRLLPLVTVGKTSFFRDDRQFHALRALLPDLLGRARARGRRLSIWSAGCATGEEPYSLAMCAAEAGAEPDEVEIVATDVNPEAVAAAARGAYEARRVKDIAAPLVEAHFDRQGDRYVVRAGLRRYISAIRPHNLVSAIFPRPASGAGWDLVFCRNVIIYFDTATTQQVLAQFHQALVPGGYLFLGYSESLFRLFEGFELTEVAGAFLYRRPERGSRVGPPAPAGQPRAAPG
ncbi:MAG: CheR family methyltransferase, partial [Anaeromyxobacteraceae bacterium]